MTTTVAEPSEEQNATAARRPLLSDQGFWSIAWRMYRKDRMAVAGLVVVALLGGLAVFAPFLANGRPYTITGILTNFYSSDVAAFRDWHKQYLDHARTLQGAGKLRPSEVVELEAETERYRKGLPRILDRLASYMKPDEAKALEELTKHYRTLLEAPVAKLDEDEYAQVGSEIETRFCTLAFEPAYKLVAAPLTEFYYGTGGAPPLVKALKDAADDAKNGDDDEKKKAEARLASLAPDVERTASSVALGVKSMAVFLEPAGAADLAKVGDDLAGAIRAFGDKNADASATDSKFQTLWGRVDKDFALRPVPPERQRLPRTTKHPVVDYLDAKDVAFIVFYLTMLLVIVFPGVFFRLTSAIPLDPSDLGLARIGVILLPALVVGAIWWQVVPDREPPADTYYKQFLRDLDVHSDEQSSISFPPIPFGENENVQEDKVSPPTWLEGEDHLVARLVARLRTDEPHLPAGVTQAELDAYLNPDDASHASAVQPSPRATAIRAWITDLEAKASRRGFWVHALGTDKGGRDVLARIVIGSRVSLAVGFVAVGIALVIGIALGAFSGYFGGWVDIGISRFTEIVMCIPSFFLILTVLAVIPKPSIWWIMLVLGLTSWPGEMRLVRGEFLRLVGLDFVTAGRALGLSNARVIFRHVLPNALAPVLVAATFGIAGAILTESSLSFLGFGVPPPEASWGSVLNEAFGAEKEMWWITIFPGFMIFVTITAYNLVGEGFRDATDPRLRK